MPSLACSRSSSSWDSCCSPAAARNLASGPRSARSSRRGDRPSRARPIVRPPATPPRNRHELLRGGFVSGGPFASALVPIAAARQRQPSTDRSARIAPPAVHGTRRGLRPAVHGTRRAPLQMSPGRGLFRPDRTPRVPRVPPGEHGCYRSLCTPPPIVPPPWTDLPVAAASPIPPPAAIFSA